MKSQVLHTVWCNMTGEATGEIWTWSLLGVKVLSEISPSHYFLCKNSDVFIWEPGQPGQPRSRSRRPGLNLGWPGSYEHSSPVDRDENISTAHNWTGPVNRTIWTGPKGDVTLVNLQRQLAMIRCCAKNRSSVAPRCGRVFAIFAVLQRVGSFSKRFKSVSCLQIRARNMLRIGVASWRCKLTSVTSP